MHNKMKIMLQIDKKHFEILKSLSEKSRYPPEYLCYLAVINFIERYQSFANHPPMENCLEIDIDDLDEYISYLYKE